MTMWMILCWSLAATGAIEDDGTPLPRGQNSPPPYVMQAFLYILIMLNHVLKELVTKRRAGSMKSSGVNNLG